MAESNKRRDRVFVGRAFCVILGLSLVSYVPHCYFADWGCSDGEEETRPEDN
jgi:hypothetical protein